MPTPKDRPRAGQEPDNLKETWITALGNWADTRLVSQTASVLSTTAHRWRADDPAVDAAYEAHDEWVDRQVLEVTRRRAMEGRPGAATLAFRSLIAAARPVETKPQEQDAEPLPPVVAAAMIRAALTALGMTTYEVPAPRAPVVASPVVPPPALDHTRAAPVGRRF